MNDRFPRLGSIGVAGVVLAAAGGGLSACANEEPVPPHDPSCLPPDDPTMAVLCIRSIRPTAPNSLEMFTDGALFGFDPAVEGRSVERPIILTLTGIGSGDGVVHLRYGEGNSGPCTYSVPTAAAAEAGVTWEGTNFRLGAESLAELDIVLWYDPDGGPPVHLLVHRARLSGQLPPDRLSIGAWSWDEDRWTSGGLIHGLIPVAEARVTPADPFFRNGITVCGVLSGDDGVLGDSTDDCASDPATWQYPPDAELDGEPAWTFRATFAAEACLVQPSAATPR